MRRILIALVPAAVIVAAVIAVALGWLSPGGSAQPSRTGDAPTASATAPATPTATPTPVPRTPTATPTPLPLTEAQRYRQAIEDRDAGDLGAAATALTLIADANGPLAPFARFRLAQVLATAGDHAGAVEEFAAALSEPALPGSLRSIAYRESATSLAALDRPNDAIESLTTVIDDPAVGASERAAALWQRSRLRSEVDDPTWSEDALSLIVASPGHPAAPLALTALEDADIEAPALPAAYTRYLARENDQATARYQELLDAEPDPATVAVAWFYLGALAERIPDRAVAITAYGESLTSDPVGTRADDAAYWRGRVAEESGDFAAAAEFYGFLVTQYPTSAFAGDGALRGALATFEAGDTFEALDRLAMLATGASVQATAAARWYDLIAGGDARVAAGVPAATEIDPRSFAAILQLAGPAALDAPFAEPLPDVMLDSNELETWLTATYGPPSTPGGTSDPEVLDIVHILVDAGEYSLARSFLVESLEVAGGNPRSAVELGLQASDLGLPDVALIATMRQLVQLPTTARLETPLGLERLGYPAPWADLLTAASDEFEVPPLLLLALIRQESAFQSDVASPAGAIGLTQVIPPTGAQIAAALDEPWGGAASLTDPATSLRYGAAYLSAQLETFEGNTFAALAAYNAGPSNARRWLDDQVWPGADGYVQAIDFEETRRYVTSVIEQYAWYRYVYGLSEIPSIR